MGGCAAVPGALGHEYVDPRSKLTQVRLQGMLTKADCDRFMMGEGDQIEKIAIVGDEQWRDDAYAFTATGLRPTLIEFFAPSRLDAARAWLGA